MAKDNKDEPAKVFNPDLIAVTKDGETLEVHKTCLIAHEKLGWKRVSP